MMEYGLIGEHLGHSFSADIHGRIGLYGYELREIAPQELDGFMRKHEFRGINVTIPYKQAVIPYLDGIDENAQRIGAVNTVVCRDGKLYGYNTDFGGMSALAEKTGIDFGGKKTLVLGTGGTSLTACAVAQTHGAEQVIRVSRSGRGGAVTYEEAYRDHADARIIINTTPCGMFPKNDGCPAELSRFPNVEGVLDAVYNPLRTVLVSQALRAGLKASGGLYMLIAQAVLAAEIFTGKRLGTEITDRIYSELLAEKENIVLIGMPGCGKSTVGRILAGRSGRRLIDTDSLTESDCGMRISEMFERYGEEYFRDRETEAVKSAAAQSGCVIATGGGAVLRPENVAALKQNGRLYFLDRPVEQLIPTRDRPLAGSAEAIRRRYEERYGIYTACADTRIEVCGSADLTVDCVERKHKV